MHFDIDALLELTKPLAPTVGDTMTVTYRRATGEILEVTLEHLGQAWISNTHIRNAPIPDDLP